MAAEENSSEKNSKYVTTGVEGLDAVLFGGLRRGGFYLLQGDPGAGKTTLALQFARACVRRGESLLYVTITESMRDLRITADSHDWSLDGIQVFEPTHHDTEFAATAGIAAETENTLFYASEIELGQTTRAILAEFERVKPDNVVFDGMGELRMLAGNPFTYRRQMLALKQYFEDNGTTVLLLDDRTNRFGEVQPETVVGGNLVLEKTLPGYGGARRRVSVTKVRGSDFRSGYHDYEIVEKKGLIVYPRLISSKGEKRYEREIFTSGVGGLDEMLGGGLPSGTTTLILGPAGVGKSTTSMQFVATALEKGYTAAIYTFDEVLDTFFERSEKLCRRPIREFAEKGQLIARQVNPAEMTPGAFAHEVREVVREQEARIVVIDSLNGYISAMPEERFLQTHLHELFAYLDELGILSIMVVAQHGFVSAEVSGGIDVSYLADTALLLRYFENSGEILQAISVLKKRTGVHERTLRQMQISGEGIVIGEPLRDFRGILTGVPQYEGAGNILPEKDKR